MIRVSHPAALWVANLLVPWAGLVLTGDIVRGIVIALGWGAGVAGVLLYFVWPDMISRLLMSKFAGVAVIFYVVSQILLWGRLRAMRRYLAGGARDDLFKAVLAAYLHDRYDEAETACKELLKKDRDDVEAMLQLALIAKGRGDAPAARRILARARYMDDAGTWDFQIQRELASLSPAP